MFNGRLGDPDESGDDVVWTAWSYLAELALSRTGYRAAYPNKLIGTQLVGNEWSGSQYPTTGKAKYTATGPRCRTTA